MSKIKLEVVSSWGISFCSNENKWTPKTKNFLCEDENGCSYIAVYYKTQHHAHGGSYYNQEYSFINLHDMKNYPLTEIYTDAEGVFEVKEPRINLK